jgi:hypothetical protein
MLVSTNIGGKEIEIDNVRNFLTYFFTCAEDGGTKFPLYPGNKLPIKCCHVRGDNNLHQRCLN